MRIIINNKSKATDYEAAYMVSMALYNFALPDERERYPLVSTFQNYDVGVFKNSDTSYSFFITDKEVITYE